MSEAQSAENDARRLRVVACRNRHCLLFGIGWPSIAMGTERRIYLYVGSWLVTITHRVIPPERSDQ
jgi:hypothetical protein